MNSVVLPESILIIQQNGALVELVDASLQLASRLGWVSGGTGIRAPSTLSCAAVVELVDTLDSKSCEH
jgi:hypothetical protein